eukprot:gnl/TRDRNA2_/TRDRNA2_174973_c1_seq3.p1 gnl/TRDRNA2_/TRDRNA2_174973_c1~~gnl/TRDRNA2_/TRDRNA2_174973_c1_seq3.p1  ORF type:complete len:163 (+),score=31.39 gnl/TRDRNA2_/TRDRNA2_174973_c1_seq3:115-603(+)
MQTRWLLALVPAQAAWQEETSRSTSQEAANAAQALRQPAPEEVAVLIATSAARPDEASKDFFPQHLSNSPWAVAALMYCHDPLLDALAAASIPRISEFCPQALGATAWSMSTLSLFNVPLRAALSKAAMRKMTEFQPEAIGGTAWSMAKISVQDMPLLNALS